MPGHGKASIRRPGVLTGERNLGTVHDRKARWLCVDQGAKEPALATRNKLHSIAAGVVESAWNGTPDGEWAGVINVQAQGREG